MTPAPACVSPAATTPPLLITMGDAAGIGPEIIVRAIAGGAAQGCIVVGDAGVLRRAAALVASVDAAGRGFALPLAQLESPADAHAAPAGSIALWQPPGLPAGLSDLPWGRIDARAGAAAAACIEAAVRAVHRG